MMKKTLLIVTAIIAACFRGMHEGQVMTRIADGMSTGAFDGMRGHVGKDLYHLIAVMAIIMFCLLAIQLYKWRPSWALVLGLLVLVWEITELSFAFTRWGHIPAYEHINFIDIMSVELRSVTQVYGLHIARFAVSLPLIIKGRIK